MYKFGPRATSSSLLKMVFSRLTAKAKGERYSEIFEVEFASRPAGSKSSQDPDRRAGKKRTEANSKNLANFRAVCDETGKRD